MRKVLAAVCAPGAVLASLACASLAHAPLAHADDREASGGTSIAYSHKGQFGIYSQFGVGYRALFRYNNNDYCGESGKSVCTGTTPPWVELGISYAPSKSIELITDFRIGLTNDFRPDTVTSKAPRELVLAPGIKAFVDDSGSVKWFTTFQVALDFTDYSADNVAASLDVGLRNVNGVLIDLHRTFGFYVHVGETIGFVRWLRFEMDGGLGLQARFP
jgi:hypothetical protein